jgi:hypothetical protein
MYFNLAPLIWERRNRAAEIMARTTRTWFGVGEAEVVHKRARIAKKRGSHVWLPLEEHGQGGSRPTRYSSSRLQKSIFA